MTFVSLKFFVFIVSVFFVVFSFKKQFRSAVLLIASILFLANYSVKFILYALLLSLLNYSIGRSLKKTKGKTKSFLYYLGQTINIGGLVFYKYLDFIVEMINVPLDLISGFNLPILNLLVPLGISYYSFQGISYLYLIYKAGDEPESSIIHFFLYMLFFPKVLAGPIERHRQFLPQLNRPIVFRSSNFSEGLQLFLWGALKKTVIADPLYVIIKVGLSANSNLEGFRSWFVFALLPLYMYYDFSGYTDMARGLGRIWGFQLAKNFHFPLFAKSVSEFWRKWHISLSSWCNDFIFNRLLLKHRKWGKGAFVYSVLITFLVIGVWHGDNINFVILGLLQGFAISIEFLTQKKRKILFQNMNQQLIAFISSLWVILFFGFSLIFFLTKDFGQAKKFIFSLISGTGEITLRGFDINEFELGVSLILMIYVFTLELVSFYKKVSVFKVIPDNIWIRRMLYFVSIVMVIYFSHYQKLFIYANF